MRITDLLDIRSIALDAAPKSKQETLDAAVALMVKSGKITDEDAYRAQVYAREEESTTGIGEGIAIPHGKCDAVNKPGLAAMVIPNGVDFDSLDGEPVTLLFLIAAPNTKDNVHLDVLSKLSMMLMDEEFTKSLRNARTPEEFLAIIDRADEEKKSVDERLAEPVEAKENQVKILAVTSCPTGIAHTYMAAEGIEKAAKAKGCFVKIETRGSGGAKNVLTAQEIADADCIIVAADAQVPMDRFDGKKVIQRQVSDGISKADELIELAMSGNAPVYKSGNAQTAAASTKKNSGGIGHQLYTQLMNGVSHMLPFVVGGGILIAIAFLIDGLLVDMNSLDAAARSNFGTITPAAAMFKQIGGVAFGFMLPVLADSVIYEGDLESEGLWAAKSLGICSPDERKEICFSIRVPSELGNEWALRKSGVKWIFSVEGEDLPQEEGPSIWHSAPKTGLRDPSAAVPIGIAVTGAFLFLTAGRSERRKE